jgi:hypothetical protein
MSGLGAKSSSNAASKYMKRLMAKMDEEAKRYREEYAGQNRQFYADLAKDGQGAYDKLGARTAASYRSEGKAAYERYYDPVAQDLRTTGYEGMMGILNNPSGVRDDAAYKFMQGEAETSTARLAGARGMGNSSNVLNALQERRLNVADTYLNSIMNRYGAAFGLGETARTQGLSMQDQYTSTGMGQRASMQAAGVGSYLQNMANSQAAYQAMLDQGANIRVGQGAQSVTGQLAQYKGAAAGAPMMALGQGMSALGSFAMMGGLGGSDGAGATPTNVNTGGVASGGSAYSNFNW